MKRNRPRNTHRGGAIEQIRRSSNSQSDLPESFDSLTLNNEPLSPWRNPAGFRGNRNQHGNINSNRNSFNPERDSGRLNCGTSRHASIVSRGDNQTHQRENRGRSHSESRGFNNEQRSAAPPRFRRGPIMGFRALENMLKLEVEDLSTKLIADMDSLAHYLHNTEIKDDIFILAVQVLRKLCTSSFGNSRRTILQMIFNEKFIKKLVTNYINMLSMQSRIEKSRNQLFWNDPDNFWTNLLEISENILNELPHFGLQVLPILMKALKINMRTFEEEQKVHISDSIKTKLDRMLTTIETIEQEEEEKRKRNEKAKESVDYEHNMQPPNDFREITVYPSVQEIVNPEWGTFVRKNVICGAYNDVEHYLDVQFRLLREDFVAPLRNGIQLYLTGEKGRRLENIRVHKKIHFLQQELINERFCFRIKFNFDDAKNTKKKRFNFENSKVFMFGSLLCFTCNNFGSIVFGKVQGRDIKDLEKGELLVCFDEECVFQYNVDYLMVECSIYYEPYYHVLTAMKHIDVNYFPMEDYIINVKNKTVEPLYLTQKPFSFAYINNLNIVKAKLNDSQKIAFSAAMIQEFTIIQGPPGTGKTHLALRVAGALIDNYEAWWKRTPMLVICYTNHALDQFLEGIIPKTERILRVGGQSKNENLQRFNLRQKDLKSRPKNAALAEQRFKVKCLFNEVNEIAGIINSINSFTIIVDFKCFEHGIQNFRRDLFLMDKNDMLHWLAGLPCSDLTNKMWQKNDFRVSEETVTMINSHNSVESDDEEIDADDDDIFDLTNVIYMKKFLLTIPNLEKEMMELNSKAKELAQIEEPTTEVLIIEEHISMRLFELERYHKVIVQRLLNQRYRPDAQEPPISLNQCKNPFELPLDLRWDLYFYWVNVYKQMLMAKMDQMKEVFRRKYELYEELRTMEDTNCMKEVLVVGMTTTSAARLRSLVQALKSPIVIVEEAAEVLEAHIVTALNPYCQQLILIGDHQQLRPSTADFKMEKKFHLGISMFERMVNNKIQCHTLNVQHRMKPEIVALITPQIYPHLQSHESVHSRKPIKGVVNDLFFLNHNHPENECNETSKVNIHEAEFIVAFARHLILNGYEPGQITILAAYLGQMFEIRNMKKEVRELQDVRIAVLDNYQGEESDIILLSLVRSNKDGSIGFLKIENRVCVALSRARDGLYIIGNMDMLCAKTGLWTQIRETLYKNNNIGSTLKLKCSVHGKVTEVAKGRDFLQISEGGCDDHCGFELACGHRCLSLCHALDRTHEKYKCKEICGKRLCEENDLHVCRKICFNDCGKCDYLVERTLNCNHTVNIECHINVDDYHCQVPVSTTLPCGHLTDKPCHADPENFRCPYPCDSIVEPCGHACVHKCHIRQDPDHLNYMCKKPCARNPKGCTAKDAVHPCTKLCFEECDDCLVIVNKKLKCSHFEKVACHFDVDQMECVKPCRKILACGHKCKSKCYEECRLCVEVVAKTNPICKHTIKVKCCEEPKRKFCKGKCPLTLPCGHGCTTNCNEDCTKQCQVGVEHSMELPCGHVNRIVPCFMAKSENISKNELVQYCNEPCIALLKCGHNCTGTCGECFQGRIHKTCSEKCNVPLVCNHECKTPCRAACRPCLEKCTFKCGHSKCRRKCGEVCTPCREPCRRRCAHQECTLRCSDICNVPPCVAPCTKSIQCGHPCIGFCGDPCPTKCLVCDRDELTEVLFGTEEDEGARFVQLKDCGHVLESSGLEEWLKQDGNEIGFKLCPKCKTPIRLTLRFSEQIKQAMADVAKVKQKYNGDKEENEQKRVLLQEAMVNLMEITYLPACTNLMAVTKEIRDRIDVASKGKRQFINKIELTALESKYAILLDIGEMLQTIRRDLISINVVDQIEFISKILRRNIDFVTNQEIEDIRPELDRLQRIIQYSSIIKNAVYAQCVPEKQRLMSNIESLLFRFTKYTDTTDAVMKDLLIKLKQEYGSVLEITDKERIQIVEAIGLKKGHWYKCPKGHPYSIGECGGAMQEAKCIECGAPIGGTNHRLVSGNAVATEMDGSVHPAWPQHANDMANYDLDLY